MADSDTPHTAKLPNHLAERLLHTNTAALFLADLKGDITYMNRAAEELLGVNTSISPQRWRDHVDEDDREYINEKWQQAIDNHEAYQEVFRWHGPRDLWIRTSIKPIRLEDGRVIGFSGTFRDITPYQSLIERLREEKTLHEQVVLSLRDNITALEQLTHHQEAIREINELLQSAHTMTEATKVIERGVRRLFNDTAGFVALLSASRDRFETVVSWGRDQLDGLIFTPEDSWAARRGRYHEVDDTSLGFVCPYLPKPYPSAYVDVPLIAHGELLGILHIEFGKHEDVSDLARRFGESLELALANVRLRMTLRDQAIREPLTGLFNRRYLEESLDREMLRAQRLGNMIGILMCDVDHFKSFNDTYGHEVGDYVLREVGSTLRSFIRDEDIAARYGGEEFCLVLPDCTLQAAVTKAEALRLGIQKMNLNYRGKDLPSVSISIGVSAFPTHGASRAKLIRAADRALYTAKQQGRNMVMKASNRPSNPSFKAVTTSSAKETSPGTNGASD